MRPQSFVLLLIQHQNQQALAISDFVAVKVMLVTSTRYSGTCYFYDVESHIQCNRGESEEFMLVKVNACESVTVSVKHQSADNFMSIPFQMKKLTR